MSAAPDWFVHDEGKGRPILLLHGLPSPPADMLALGRRLRGRILVPHLPGYGLSRTVSGPHSVSLIENGLVRLLREREATDAAVVGYSMGAYRALSLALRTELRISAMVLLSGFASLSTDERAGLLAFAHALRGGVDLRDQAPPRFLAPSFASQPAQARAASAWLDLAAPEVMAEELEDAAVAPGLEGRLGELSCRVLVRTGELDLAVPVHHARALAASIRGAKLEIVPGVAHAQWIEDPNGTAAAVASFVDGTDHG